MLVHAKQFSHLQTNAVLRGSLLQLFTDFIWLWVIIGSKNQKQIDQVWTGMLFRCWQTNLSPTTEEKLQIVTAAKKKTKKKPTTVGTKSQENAPSSKMVKRTIGSTLEEIGPTVFSKGLWEFGANVFVKGHFQNVRCQG